MSYKRFHEGPLWSLEVRQGQPTDRKSALGLLSRLSGTNISLIFYGKVLTSSIIFQIFYNIFSKTERWDESGFLCLGNVCRGVIKIFYGDSDRSLIMSNHFTTQHRISNCAQQNFTKVTTLRIVLLGSVYDLVMRIRFWIFIKQFNLTNSWFLWLTFNEMLLYLRVVRINTN